MTHPLDLNMASRPIRNNTLLWLIHGVCAALIVAGTVWNVTTYTRHRRELTELRSTVDSIDNVMNELGQRENRAQRGIDRHDLTYLNVQASKANDVIARKALSWTRLFNQMEQVVPYEVRMMSIRPVFTFGRRSTRRERVVEGSVPVSVGGAAKSLEALLEFERSLLDDPHFSNVEPHRFTQDTSEVLFDLRFLYFPEPPPESPATGPEAEAGGEAADATPAPGPEEEADVDAAAPVPEDEVETTEEESEPEGGPAETVSEDPMRVEPEPRDPEEDR